LTATPSALTLILCIAVYPMTDQPTFSASWLGEIAERDEDIRTLVVYELTQDEEDPLKRAE
jgi:hypothetical protein